MPWKECSAMDERLRFCGSPASRRADGGTLQGVWHSPARPAIRSSIVIRNAACRGSRTEVDARIGYAKPTSVPGGKLHLERKARAPQLGVLVKSASACCAGSPLFPARPKVPSTRCSIAMAWSNAAVDCVAVLREPLCLGPTAQPAVVHRL